MGGGFNAKKGDRVLVPSFWMGTAVSPWGRRQRRGRGGARWHSGFLAILQTQLPGEGGGNCPASGRICIFLITRIHCKTDDSAGLVLFSCLFLPLNTAKWSAINGHTLNCLAQHVQHWEQEMIVSGPLLRKPVEVSWGRVKIQYLGINYLQFNEAKSQVAIKCL